MSRQSAQPLTDNGNNDGKKDRTSIGVLQKRVESRFFFFSFFFGKRREETRDCAESLESLMWRLITAGSFIFVSAADAATE